MGELYQTICKPFLKQEGFTLNIQEPRVRLRQVSMNPEQKEAKAFSLSQPMMNCFTLNVNLSIGTSNSAYYNSLHFLFAYSNSISVSLTYLYLFTIVKELETRSIAK